MRDEVELRINERKSWRCIRRGVLGLTHLLRCGFYTYRPTSELQPYPWGMVLIFLSLDEFSGGISAERPVLYSDTVLTCEPTRTHSVDLNMHTKLGRPRRAEK